VYYSTTLVDNAEFIWRMAERHTQADIGVMMGWSREKISQYAMLEKISPVGWNKIATVFLNMVAAPAHHAQQF